MVDCAVVMGFEHALCAQYGRSNLAIGVRPIDEVHREGDQA
jgi:hypothetical protein